jgi:hypothetical protein
MRVTSGGLVTGLRRERKGDDRAGFDGSVRGLRLALLAVGGGRW